MIQKTTVNVGKIVISTITSSGSTAKEIIPLDMPLASENFDSRKRYHVRPNGKDKFFLGQEFYPENNGLYFMFFIWVGKKSTYSCMVSWPHTSIGRDDLGILRMHVSKMEEYVQENVGVCDMYVLVAGVIQEKFSVSVEELLSERGYIIHFIEPFYDWENYVRPMADFYFKTEAGQFIVHNYDYLIPLKEDRD